jgi:hypothetical protein
VHKTLFEVGGAGDTRDVCICYEAERLWVEHVARAAKEQQLADPAE